MEAETVKISHENLQKCSKQQRSKFVFDLGELKRQMDGDYDISRLLIYSLKLRIILKTIKTPTEHPT
jgi:hypothetical protein